jgi:hypothetical protein
MNYEPFVPNPFCSNFRMKLDPWKFSVYILILWLSVSTEAKLKRGRYPQFNDFCTGKDIYVGVPWDCSGYIHCQMGNGIKMTFWIECPASLYFSLKHKTCTWPDDVSQPCPNVAGR